MSARFPRVVCACTGQHLPDGEPGADFPSPANLYGANLYGANLEGVRNFPKGIEIPKGFRLGACGCCLECAPAEQGGAR